MLTGKIEMGQGVMTSLAQMAAEELDVPLSSMRVVMGDTQLCPADTDGGTWGSLTTRNFGPSLRSAAARARAILMQLASEQLGIPKDQLITRDGFVINRADENVRVSYASLAGGKKRRSASPTQTPPPKAFSQFTLSGKPAIRIDAFEKVTGQGQIHGGYPAAGDALRPNSQAARSGRNTEVRGYVGSGADPRRPHCAHRGIAGRFARTAGHRRPGLGPRQGGV